MKVVRKGTQKQHLAFLKDCWWLLLLSAWPWGPLHLLNLGFTSNQQGFHLWNSGVILKRHFTFVLGSQRTASIFTDHRIQRDASRLRMGSCRGESRKRSPWP